MASEPRDRDFPLSKSRPLLVVGAVVIFLLLASVMTLTLRLWLDAATLTEGSGERRSQVSAFETLDREASVVVRAIDHLGPGDPTGDIESQLDELGALAATMAVDAGLDEQWLADEIEGIDALFVGPTRWQGGNHDAVHHANQDLETAIRERLIDAEESYVEYVHGSLTEQSGARGVLLTTAGLLGVLGIGYALLARRAARQARDSAYSALLDTQKQQRRVLDSVKDVIFSTDEHGRWTFLSGSWEELSGHSVESCLGRRLIPFIEPDDAETVEHRFDALATEATGQLRLEAQFVRADGSLIWVEIWARPDEDDGGTFGTLVDITQRRSFEARLQHQALHDPLTGLANRDLLTDRVEQAMRSSRRTGDRTAVLFLDLDRFKLVNDSLGHDMGDMLLCEVAARLRAKVRGEDTVARLGGDEFVVVCEHLDPDRDTALEQAVAISKEIELSIGEPFHLGANRVSITASVGITLGHAVDRVNTLISEADAAMYQAKEMGKARHEVFDDRLRARADSRLRLEHELRTAISESQFMLYHQPILDTHSGRPSGTEALLRWQHPERGVLAPGDFLEVAEEAGLMPAIGAWVVRQACRDIARWRACPGTEDLRVAVNLSARELCSFPLISVMEMALAANDLPPDALCVEVTEHHLIDGQDEAVRHLWALHSLGVTVAMDDFGTGYSSLSYLRRLPIDELKIDREFVERLGSHADDESIVAAIVQMARTLGLVTIAEGVELPSQLSRLQELGVDRVQGYLLARPAPAASLDDLLLHTTDSELRLPEVPDVPETPALLPTGTAVTSDRGTS